MTDHSVVKNAKEQWRFIDGGSMRGALNMALDMAIAQSAVEKSSPPTLRVYGWKPPAISLGYHQSERDVELDRCKKDGIDVVLRPTGGRAILHHNEITYAVSIPPSSSYFAPDIHTVYSQISRGLVAALQRLEVNVHFDRAEKTPKDFSKGELASLCYASSIKYEISIGRKKLVGSAQRRINGGVLQHGSILIGDEHLEITHYLAAKNEAWRKRVSVYMKKNTISLNEVSTRPISYSQVADAIKTGFAKELNLGFEQGDFSEAEMKHATEIEKKFSILAT